ncbi:CG15522 [Drosophila busckii]|uniref:CG15522 n=1 Tax=Drosophila busckii TaxID=30019 RepID=A0A0M4EQ52_DROBS|nr:CG15522 [Drosophila busckii]
MHQVLSYDTAVRANSSRDYREYVTKRTCYLLGNFATERKYHMRQLLTQKALNGVSGAERSVQLNSVDYGNLQELRAYQKNKEQLLVAAQVLNNLLQQDESERYLATSLNTEIFNKYISCTQNIPPNTNIEASRFIEQLIDNTVARQRDCLRIIQVVIDNHLANSQL